ncbi:hypothetical protein B0T14DRAFT_517129 [Immersiella caudata]|uniref:Uncharacterized protein n=1 Tax=Immersiella caudata TaxID=314043 RepID=A0AA39WYB8_9PEZI|nr:hypothetical protein B0T14DRAFT_517129 [Immersiella caudata]
MLLPIGIRVLSLFRELSDLPSGTTAAAIFQRNLITESERFTLWAQDLSLSRPGHVSLDYRVRDAEVMRSRLADILGELGNHLEELRSIIAGKRQPAELQFNEDAVRRSPSLSSRGTSDSGSSDSAAGATFRGSGPPSSGSLFHEVDFR